MQRIPHNLLTGLVLISSLALLGCPGAGKVPGAPGVPGSAASSVDPNTCGNYAASDAGRKLKGFLEATVALEATVKNTENYLKDTCLMMGKELGIAPEGDTKTVCAAVEASLKEHLQVGVKAGAKLALDYKPAVCTVDIEATAQATAKCEAKAEAEVSVVCEGSCSGTCKGRCDGDCAGTAGTGGSEGQCEGQCSGTCHGECSAGCEGHANVEASAECKAEAEVSASVDAKCTEPEVAVTFDAGVVVDKSKVDAAVAAIKVGLPRVLMIDKKISGPVKAAFTTWASSAEELAGASGKLYASLGDQAKCVGGQLAAAVGMVAGIQASIDVQIEVSASVSGSASAEGGA